MNADLTPTMIEAFKRYAAMRDSLDHYGYSGGTTAERRQYTRLMNKAMNAAMEGTSGPEDPLFRRRWFALAFV